MTREELINLISLEDVENIEKQLNVFNRDRKLQGVPSWCIKDEKLRNKLEKCEKSWTKMCEAFSKWAKKQNFKTKKEENEAFDEMVYSLNIDEDMITYTGWMLEDCHN